MRELPLVFYKDCFINKEIAFILNIPYHNSTEKKENEIIFALDDEDKKSLRKKNYEYGTDYIDIYYLCDYLNQFSRPYEQLYIKGKYETDI